MSAPARVSDFDPGNALRQPPHSFDAERALLGAILMNNRAYERVADFLMPDHFAEPVNGRIYGVIAMMVDDNQPVNPVTLKPYLERDQLIVAAGGVKYLGTIAASAVTVINANAYGQLIYDLWLRRELIGIGEDVVNEAYDAQPDEPAQAQIEAIQERLYQLDRYSESDYQMVSLDKALIKAVDLAERAHRNEGACVGATTGLRDLDRKMSGMHPGDLIIVAGASSMGKTALAITIAMNAANYFKTTDRPEHAGKRALCFSLEMGDEQLATRILAHAAGVSSFHMRSGGLSTSDWTRIIDATHGLHGTPLDVDPTPGITLPGIRSRCRKIARNKTATGESALGLIVIDYLQLISPPRGERRENRTQELAVITRGLKMLAKEFNVPVMALSQISRSIEQREDKRPQLSDLRESGTIENDADVVMMVYREQYYLERNEPVQYANETTDKFIARVTNHNQRLEKCHGKGDVIVAKQRHGPIGTVTLAFDSAGTHFSNVDKDDGGGFEQRTLV